jgi:hypothetical protein
MFSPKNIVEVKEMKKVFIALLIVGVLVLGIGSIASACDISDSTFSENLPTCTLQSLDDTPSGGGPGGGDGGAPGEEDPG